MNKALPRHFPWLLLVGFCLFLHFQGLGVRPLFHEEPRRAIVAREMINRGSWIVPTINGAHYLAKPPLFPWLIASSSLALGDDVTETSARLVSSLSVLFTVLLVYAFAAYYINRQTGLLAGLFTATSGLILEQAQFAEIDMNFTFWMTGAMLFLFSAIQSETRRPWLWLTSYLFLALAFLAKGPPCMLFFFPLLIGLLFHQNTRRRILRPAHLAGLLLFLVLIGTWATLFINQVGWDSLSATLDKEMLQRAKPGSLWSWLGKTLVNPISFLACLLPWTFLLLPAICGTGRKSRPVMGNPLVHFTLLTAAISVVLFSLSSGRASRYLLPIVPLLAIAEGAACCRLLAGELPRKQAAFCRGFITMLCGAIAVGSIVAMVLYLAGKLKLQAGSEIWIFATIALSLGLIGVFKSTHGRTVIGITVLMLIPCLYRTGYTTYRYPRDIKKYSMAHLTDPVKQLVDQQEATLYTITFSRPEFFFYLNRGAQTAGINEINRQAATNQAIVCLAKRTEAQQLRQSAPGVWHERFAFEHKGRDMLLLTNRPE